MPKDPAEVLGRLSDTDIVIASLVLAFVFAVVFYFIVRSLLDKLGVSGIYGLPIPLFLVALFAVVVISSSLSSHPIACQSCHPMKAPARELSYSAHTGVGCAACHKKSSIMSLPIQKLEQARMLVSYIGGTTKLSGPVSIDNSNCLECHSDVKKGVKTRFKLMMSHREVIDAGISCVDCHADIAHKTRSARPTTSMMEKCSSCHNDEEASARCETCHLDSVWLGMKPSKAWGIEHGENWPKLHGSRSLYVCKLCHYENDCKRCHSPVPHPEGWQYVHGEEAKSNPKDCITCHKDESLCKACHRIAMPHSSVWINIHQVQEKLLGKKVCLSCHREKDCVQCHEKHHQRCDETRAGQ